MFMTWHHEDIVTEACCMLHDAPCRLRTFGRSRRMLRLSVITIAGARHTTSMSCPALPCIVAHEYPSRIWYLGCKGLGDTLVGGQRQGAEAEDAGVSGAAAALISECCSPKPKDLKV